MQGVLIAHCIKAGQPVAAAAAGRTIATMSPVVSAF